jgi:hypothetical protein
MAAIHTDHHQNSTGDISDLDPNTQIEVTTPRHQCALPTYVTGTSAPSITGLTVGRGWAGELYSTGTVLVGQP